MIQTLPYVIPAKAGIQRGAVLSGSAADYLANS